MPKNDSDGNDNNNNNDDVTLMVKMADGEDYGNYDDMTKQLCNYEDDDNDDGDAMKMMIIKIML